MPRYEFQRPARAALLDQLVAAGLDPLTVRVESNASGADTTCWVTCEAAEYDRVASVVAAHDAAAVDHEARQARDDDDRDRVTLWGAATTLATERDLLAGAGSVTSADTRRVLLLVVRVLLALLRYLARRGL